MARSPRRVLAIEDNPEHLFLVEAVLTESGRDVYCFDQAGSLAAGLALLKRHAYDVILCDLNLEDASAVETVAAVAELDPALPIIFMTNAGDGELRAVGLGGADRYRLVPKREVATGQLQRAVRAVLDGRPAAPLTATRPRLQP